MKLFNTDLKYLKKDKFLIYKIDNFFDQEFYTEIKDNFPEVDNKILDVKDNFGKKVIRFNELSYKNEHQKKIFLKLNEIILGKSFFNFFVKKFFLKIAIFQNNFIKKLKYLRYPVRDSEQNVLLDNLSSKISVGYNFSFIKNNGGIVPHVDAKRKYLSLMLYFPDSNIEEIEYGTTFWDSNYYNKTNTHITDNNQIKNFKEKSKLYFKTPFVSNCLYGFIRNDLSWHTVEPVNISQNYIRKSININFYYKN
jgi:hypothetical protein